MPTKDEAIEAIRAVRQQISDECGNDTKRLLEHYRELEKKYAARMLRASKAARNRPAAEDHP